MEIDANLIFGCSGERIGVVFFTLWLIVAAINLKQQWKNLSDSWKIFWLFIFASAVTAFYGFVFAPSAENGCMTDDECNLANNYNLHRNLAILFFGIFGGGLAIWARWAHQKQLKHTETQIEQNKEQIDNSYSINRNDRFVKASEMLGKDKAGISHRGGLYMLNDLVTENLENEYIRCVEIITNWLKENSLAPDFEPFADDERNLKSEFSSPSPDLIQMACGVFKHREIAKLQKDIEKHADKFYKSDKADSGYWPNMGYLGLSNIDLMGAYLEKANLQETRMQKTWLDHAKLNGAYLEKANLKSASLQDAKMIDANLTATNLTRAELSRADLTGAELQVADLAGANLTMTILSGAKMKYAEGLTKEQVLQATWKTLYGDDLPPELPDNLIQDPEVKKWLNNPGPYDPNDLDPYLKS